MIKVCWRCGLSYSITRCPDCAKSRFQLWYARNKLKVAARRRNKYQSDEDFRQAVINRAQDWQKANPERASENVRRCQGRQRKETA